MKEKWEVYFTHHYKNNGMTNFYLLPTIEYFRDIFMDDDGDCSFNICFAWLFWTLTISRYWGSAYGA